LDTFLYLNFVELFFFWRLKSNMSKTTKIRRKDIIQPDQFITNTDIIIAYCSKHKTKLIAILISLMVVVFSGFWVKHNQNKNFLKMESLYFELEQIVSLEEINFKDKINQIELLLSKFSNGPQKQRAFLLFANEYYNEGSYDKAIEYYQGILNSSSTPFNHQLAKIGVAHSLEGKKEYKSAINTYKTVIQNPNDYPLFDIYLGLARCYELNKEKNQALLILREMQNKFPSNFKIQIINSKIKNLDI
jgi:tetratricopeptide (TPR) repeat protein